MQFIYVIYKLKIMQLCSLSVDRDSDRFYLEIEKNLITKDMIINMNKKFASVNQQFIENMELNFALFLFEKKNYLSKNKSHMIDTLRIFKEQKLIYSPTFCLFYTEYATACALHFRYKINLLSNR